MNRKKRSQKGAVAVELAVTLPVLLLFLVTIFDLGLLLRSHQVISNAAREGAHFSALPKNYVGVTNPSASLAAIRQHVVDYCAEEGVAIDSSEVSVDQTTQVNVTSGTVQGSTITVSVDRPLLFLRGFSGGSSTVTLGSEATFVNLY